MRETARLLGKRLMPGHDVSFACHADGVRYRDINERMSLALQYKQKSVKVYGVLATIVIDDSSDAGDPPRLGTRRRRHSIWDLILFETPAADMSQSSHHR